MSALNFITTTLGQGDRIRIAEARLLLSRCTSSQTRLLPSINSPYTKDEGPCTVFWTLACDANTQPRRWLGNTAPTNPSWSDVAALWHLGPESLSWQIHRGTRSDVGRGAAGTGPECVEFTRDNIESMSVQTDPEMGEGAVCFHLADKGDAAAGRSTRSRRSETNGRRELSVRNLNFEAMDILEREGGASELVVVFTGELGSESSQPRWGRGTDGSLFHKVRDKGRVAKGGGKKREKRRSLRRR